VIQSKASDFYSYIQSMLGGGEGGDNKEGLFWFRKITSTGSQCEEEALGGRKGGDFANDGVVVGIPRLSGLGDSCTDGFS
jgi:hypothetical protein